jgi:hypothetical protein
VSRLRLITTDYGRPAQARCRGALRALGESVAEVIEIVLAFISILAFWALLVVAGAIAYGVDLGVTRVGALCVGIWVGFLPTVWIAALRRMKARAQRRLQRDLRINRQESFDDDHVA